MPIDVPWTLVAPLAGAFVALLAFVIGQMQRSRQESQQRISTAIDAKLGGVLLDLKKFELDASQRLSDFRTEATSYEQQLAEHLSKADELTQKLDDLVKRGAQLIPPMEEAESIPAILALRARQALDKAEYAHATSILLSLANNNDADARSLHTGGDLARLFLRNDKLAAKLYKAATEADPNHVSAAAEYLALTIILDPNSRKMALQQIFELAENNPLAEVPTRRCIDATWAISDYEGVLRISEALLGKSQHKAMVWRNIALAHQWLRHGDDLIVEAFENGMNALRETGLGALVIAEAYARFLRYKDLDRGLATLDEGLYFEPVGTALHMAKGELLLQRGMPDEARWQFEWVEKYGGAEERLSAAIRKRGCEQVEHERSLGGSTGASVSVERNAQAVEDIALAREKLERQARPRDVDDAVDRRNVATLPD
jgi:hypothetical protein